MFINLEMTKQLYNNFPKDWICQCENCKLFYSNVKDSFVELANWLKQYNIEIDKPFELSSIELDDGTIEYLEAQYVVIGTCEDDFSVCVGDIEISPTHIHPSTNINEKHFVLGASSIFLHR